MASARSTAKLTLITISDVALDFRAHTRRLNCESAPPFPLSRLDITYHVSKKVNEEKPLVLLDRGSEALTPKRLPKRGARKGDMTAA